MTLSHAANRRPRIGITAEGRGADDSIILPTEYTDAVLRAGGEPVPLAPWQPDVTNALAALDALILAGGGDIAPERYGSPGHPAVYEVDAERDAGELALTALALQTGLPLLGICRGAQLLNVALGGTLHEHLPDVLDGRISHRAEPPGMMLHTVSVAAGSRLEAIVGHEEVTTASWHHQGLHALAPLLRPVAWADDDCIEAVEPAEPSAHWLVAVQWHPELTAATDPAQQRIFDSLVNAARHYASQRSAIAGTPEPAMTSQSSALHSPTEGHAS